MSFERCALDVAEALGRELTKAETKELTDRVANLVKQFESNPTAEGLDDFLKSRIDNLVRDSKTLAFLEQRNAALNAQKRILLEERFKNNWEDAPDEFFKALFDNSNLNRPGARDGVAAAQGSLANTYVSGMFSDLEAKGVFDFAKSNNADIKWQIWQAQAELSKSAPDQAFLAKLPREAVETAEIFNRYAEIARNDANRAGAAIGKLEGRVLRRTHDQTRIMKAAGNEIPTGRQEHQDAWVGWVSERIDWEKSMPDVPVEKRMEILGDLYQQFANGYHVKFAEGGATGLQGFANIGKKMSKERVIHFKDARADFDYHETFGSGGSLVEANMVGLKRMAQDTGLMHQLGPNAEMNIDMFVDSTMKRLTKEGRGADAAKLKNSWAKAKEEIWPHVTGEINIPANAVVANVSRAAQNIMRMADLGGAAISSITDLGAVASVLRYSGSRTAGDFFSGVREALEGAMGLVQRGGFTPEQKAMAAEMGIFLDTMAPIGNRYNEGDAGAGRFAEWSNRFFKINGLSWITDNSRMAAASSTGARHAMVRNMEFESLPAGMKDYFGQFGLGKTEWNIIRKSEVFKSVDGREFMTPGRVKDVPDDVWASALKSQGKKPTPAAIDKYKTEVITKYRNLFSETANLSATQPGLIERSFMLKATRPGTWQGEAMRHFWMYKSFMVSIMRKHMGRELLGYGVENMSIPQAMMHMLRGNNPSGAAGIASLFTFGTLAGYAAMSLKDISKGREPRVPDTPTEFAKVFAAAAAQGGAAGIYGDFLFGEAKSRFGAGPLETFLGPTWRRASELWDIGQAVKTAEGEAVPKAIKFGLTNAPGVGAAYNLFYTRAALDYLIVYRMQEYMNPGYLRRMEQRLKKDKDQEYIVPPSSVIPYGGF